MSFLAGQGVGPVLVTLGEVFEGVGGGGRIESLAIDPDHGNQVSSDVSGDGEGDGIRGTLTGHGVG